MKDDMMKCPGCGKEMRDEVEAVMHPMGCVPIEMLADAPAPKHEAPLGVEESRHDEIRKAASECANAEDTAEYSFVRGACWADATGNRSSDFRNWIHAQKQLSTLKAEADRLTQELQKSFDRAEEAARLALDAEAEADRMREILEEARSKIRKIYPLENQHKPLLLEILARAKGGE